MCTALCLATTVSVCVPVGVCVDGGAIRSSNAISAVKLAHNGMLYVFQRMLSHSATKMIRFLLLLPFSSLSVSYYLQLPLCRWLCAHRGRREGSLPPLSSASADLHGSAGRAPAQERLRPGLRHRREHRQGAQRSLLNRV